MGTLPSLKLGITVVVEEDAVKCFKSHTMDQQQRLLTAHLHT